MRKPTKTTTCDLNGIPGVCDDTPLTIALKSHGNPDMTELLLDYGADPNATDRNGRTPLDLAIEYKREESAKIIRDFGGKPSLKAVH